MGRKGAELNIKPEFLSCFHADLIDSLMQGFGRRGNYPRSAAFNRAAYTKGFSSSKPKGVHILPPLNLSKVREGLVQQKSLDNELSAKKNKILECTGVQLVSGETQTESVRSPKRTDRSVKENDTDCTISGNRGLQRQNTLMEDKNPSELLDSRKLESERSIAPESGVDRPPLLHYLTVEMDFHSANATLTGSLTYRNKKNEASAPTEVDDEKQQFPDHGSSGEEIDQRTKECKAEVDAKMLSMELVNSLEGALSKLTKAETAKCEAKVSIYLGDHSSGPKATAAQQPGRKVSAVQEQAKGVGDRSPRKCQRPKLKQPVPAKIKKCPRVSLTRKDVVNRTKAKPLKLTAINKSSIPIGFGGAPVETIQTSRISRIVASEASPRMVLTDRNAYKKDPYYVHEPISSSIQSKQWEVLTTPETILKQYGRFLTEYERTEIVHFPEIYYIGNPLRKVQASGMPGPCNSDGIAGFDNEKGDYIAVLHDHVAYRYEILGRLGNGSFGQVLKCSDHKHKVVRAIKIIRNKKQFLRQALTEISILEFLKDKAEEDGADYNIVKVLESFDFRGHLCITFAVHNINLYELIKMNSFQGLDLAVIKCFARQLLVALKFLQRLRIIHGDLKPENILLQHHSMPKIKLIDFGSSCFEPEKIYTYIQSRFYRAPEVILGLPYDMMIDIWSLGCILAELFTGYPLFPGENELEQLACMMEILGIPPISLVSQSTRKKMFFDVENRPRIIPNSAGIKHLPNSKDLKSTIGCSDAAFVDFLACCLKWDKNQRMTPQRLLQHEWMTQGQQTNCNLQISKKRSTNYGPQNSVKQTKLSYSTRK